VEAKKPRALTMESKMNKVYLVLLESQYSIDPLDGKLHRVHNYSQVVEVEIDKEDLP
jgi:hypothetical protein